MPLRLSTSAKLLRPTNWLAGFALAVCCGGTGCRNRAYTEVYVDNMAAEIRTLEDQLYQYDNEYRALEQEIESLRTENDRLRQSGPLGQTRSKGSLPQSSHSPGAYEFHPRQNYNLAPGEIIVPDPIPNQFPETSSKSPSSSGAQTPGSSSILESGLAPSTGTGTNASNPLQSKPTGPPTNPAAPSSGNVLPTPGFTPNAGGLESIKPDELAPPTIQPGTPMPPSQPVLPSAGAPITGKSPAPNQLEINLGRIEIPGQLTSARTGKGQLKILREEVSDSRIVDLAFHGSLCRGYNFDQQPDDDGLYLVLQPKNDAGQFVPVSATLSIVALDPAREGEAAYVSRWNYSAAEVQTRIQPIGSSQGIHLSLPWNGPDPIADRVVVFVRYTMSDGRKLISEKEIVVSGKDHARTVWVPRVIGESRTTQLARPSPAVPSPANPTNVVRPASATMPIEPAPQPGIR